MTDAQKLAWELYILRVQRIVESQLEPWEHDRPVGVVICHPPNAAQLDAITRALVQARDKALHAALGPVTDAIDALDNSPHTKESKRARAELQKIHNALHALKSTAYALAV